LWGTAGVVVWLCVLTLSFQATFPLWQQIWATGPLPNGLACLKVEIDIIFQAPFTG
jgi:hypothetical protein